MIAPALSPGLGGLIVDNSSWRWVFFANVPLALAAALLAWLKGFGGRRLGRGCWCSWSRRVAVYSRIVLLRAFPTVVLGAFGNCRMRHAEPQADIPSGFQRGAVRDLDQGPVRLHPGRGLTHRGGVLTAFGVSRDGFHLPGMIPGMASNWKPYWGAVIQHSPSTRKAPPMWAMPGIPRTVRA